MMRRVAGVAKVEGIACHPNHSVRWPKNWIPRSNIKHKIYDTNTRILRKDIKALQVNTYVHSRYIRHRLE